jgi:hypothetical protein
MIFRFLWEQLSDYLGAYRVAVHYALIGLEDYVLLVGKGPVSLELKEPVSLVKHALCLSVSCFMAFFFNMTLTLTLALTFALSCLRFGLCTTRKHGRGAYV